MTKKLTTAEFIERAKKVHGGKYDYSKVQYINGITPVTIACLKHGEFKQKPQMHLQNNGCPMCGGTRKMDTQSFISKAHKLYGDKYDYSKVNYINNKTKVVIICPKHGEFKIEANSHLQGYGCKLCTGYKSTKESFIKKSRKVHGDKYDYSKVSYTNAGDKVTIICPLHGEFVQTASQHLHGYGCIDCGGSKLRTTDEFIVEARKKHGDKFDYSNVVYINDRKPVTIICPEHGAYKQAPRDHLRGGCKKCSVNRSNTEEFITDSRLVHGDKYDYSSVKYETALKNVTIICPEHGAFQQKPNAHKNGSGCPACAPSGVDTTASGILYYLRIETRNQTFWKIGITNRSVEDRFSGADMKCITTLKVWHYEQLRRGLDRETEILRQNRGLLYTGNDEPLIKGGNTELFTQDVLGLDPEYK